MGKVTIMDDTTKAPITLIGRMAGICYGSDVKDELKNYARGKNCIDTNHGRTLEFPEVYMKLEGYSARVIREYYTHIAGGPTRLQASTRYINYEKGFDYVTPPKIAENMEALMIYEQTMAVISDSLRRLEDLGIPREDSAMALPLGMTTVIVDKRGLRSLVEMSRQRLCTRAYWEYRQLMKDIMKALSEYSEEWKWVVDNMFMAKCDYLGKCTEMKSCGRHEK